MIKENQRLLNQINIFSDAVFMVLSILLAYWVRFGLLHGTTVFPLEDYVLLGVCAAGLGLMTYAFLGLYESYRAVRFHREAARLLLGTLLDTVILVAGLFVFRLTEMSRWLLVFYCGITYVVLVVKRGALRLLLRRYRAMGYNQKHVLIVGDSAQARRYLEQIQREKTLGYLADGYVADSEAWDELPCLGDYDALEQLLEENSFDEVVVAMPMERYQSTGHVIAACEKSGTKLSMIPFYANYMPSNPQIDNLNGLPMINLRRIPLDNLGNAFLKRAMDIVGALLLIVLTSPVLLLTAIGVKLSSPGPILFQQERVGRNKKTFFMYKFRSMRVNAKETTGWSTNQDPRKTRFGALIRKLSIDELPQFFNVLKGDMSLVGPRPEVPFYVEQFKEEIPRYMVKHQVRPGITGWAQVCGFRGDTSIKGRIEHDVYYIETWSVFFDLKILLLTVFRVVNREQLS